MRTIKILKRADFIVTDTVTEELIKLLRIRKYNRELYYYDFEQRKHINCEQGKLSELQLLLNFVRLTSRANGARETELTAGQKKLIFEKIKFIAKPAKLDTDNIYFMNGKYNPRSGNLEPLTNNDFNINVIPFNYNANANTKAAQEYLAQITEGNEYKIMQLLQCMALAMLPHNKNNKIINIYGTAGTGKSVLGRVISEVAGGDNCTFVAPYELKKDFASSQLFGKTCNINYDISNRYVTDGVISAMKQLSGEDTIKADVKFSEPIVFRSYAQNIFIGNKKLKFGENDELHERALGDRFVFIELSKRFRYTDMEDVDRLKDLLQVQNLQAFARLACKTIQKNGIIRIMNEKVDAESILTADTAVTVDNQDVDAVIF
jgi:phage/plasmid-associated DNA primase